MHVCLSMYDGSFILAPYTLFPYCEMPCEIRRTLCDNKSMKQVLPQVSAYACDAGSRRLAQYSRFKHLSLHESHGRCSMYNNFVEIHLLLVYRRCILLCRYIVLRTADSIENAPPPSHNLTSWLRLLPDVGHVVAMYVCLYGVQVYGCNE